MAFQDRIVLDPNATPAVEPHETLEHREADHGNV